MIKKKLGNLFGIISVVSLLLLVSFACGRSAKQQTEADTAEVVVEEINAEPADTAMSEQTGEGKPMVIDFYATWCGPCRQIAPLFDQLKDKYSDRIDFQRVDVDVDRQMAMKYNIEAMPTFVFLDAAGNEVDRIVGADADALSDKVSSMAR